MGCSTCDKSSTSAVSGCKSNGMGCINGCNKFTVVDWLADIEPASNSVPCPYVEIQFKNCRKDYYLNDKKLPLQIGDIVVVESMSGYDVGTVTLTGDLVLLQMKRKEVISEKNEFKKIFRLAHDLDKIKWHDARNLEKETMFQARTFALKHELTMKISDVEYQSDKTKAIFYYTAENRIDFRELIKTMAEAFKVRIEMRQIGARQEAGRLGGVGSCGRELCCATWLSDFRSVSTSSARYQQLSLNPQKLAGQCGKLKCCLNYELDCYLDALNHFPDTNTKLQLMNGVATHFKSDIIKSIMWYSESINNMRNIVPLKVSKVKEIIEMNNKNVFPPSLKDFMFNEVVVETIDYTNVVGQDSLTRFDESGKKNKKGKRFNKKFRKNNKNKTVN